MRIKPDRFCAVAMLVASLIVAVPAQAQTKGCLEGVGKKVPVLFVHGFNGSPNDWEGKDSLRKLIDRNTETYTNPFDYSESNKRWVTDGQIGARLSREIACTAQSSRDEGGNGKVIVIGHSMGGLAAQFAVSQTVNGRRVAEDTGLVIAIGTPFAGSYIANWAMDVARAYCAIQNIPNCEHDIDTYSAVGGLRQGSAKLSQLPPFPTNVPVRTIAGNVQHAQFNIFGVELESLDSDLVVTTDSATKLKANTDPVFGGGKSIVECVGVMPIPVIADASCEHTRLLSDKNVQTAVVDVITQYMRRITFQESGDRFIGDWHASRSTLTFNKDGSGKNVIDLGTCYGDDQYQCQAIVNFTWQPTDAGIVYTVNSISYVAHTTFGDTFSAAGEVSISEFVSVGMTLEVAYRSTSLIERDPSGIHNGYYCSKTAPPEEKRLCD